MHIKNFFKKLRTTRKRYIVAVVTGLLIAVPIAVHAGFGPSRPVFDWNNPADRVGSINGPVFNSFINTPTYGDERAFVDARDSNIPKAFADTVDVQPDQEYTVRAYVHNNANQDTNDAAHDFKGIAKNTTVRFKVLAGVANANEVTGYVSADNIAPGYPTTVYDTVKLKNDTKTFSLEYVAGSARIENNAHPFPGLALPDSIVTTGTKIGYEQLNGDVPGCFEFTNIVTIKVRVKAPKLQVSKTVSKVEAPKLSDTQESIAVDRGQTITWRIDYKNTGSDIANNVTLRDTIPKGVTLVPGSITLIDAKHQSGQPLPDTALSSGGANAGSYSPNGNGIIRFRTTVDKDVKDCELTNVAFVRGEGIPESSDSAKITINNCKPSQPKFSCDLLKKELIGDRTYRFSVNATAIGGATINHYVFDFGDGSTPLVTDKTSVDHKYATDGNFVATVKVAVDVNGQTQTAESPACSQPITFGTTVLPNTGSGDVIGIFSVVTIAGAFLHRLFLAKRV